MNTVEYYTKTLKNVKSLYSTPDDVWIIFLIGFLVIIFILGLEYRKSCGNPKRQNSRKMIKRRRSKAPKKEDTNVIGSVAIVVLLVMCVYANLGLLSNYDKINRDIENGLFVETTGEFDIHYYRWKYGSNDNYGVVRDTDLRIHDIKNEYNTYAKYTKITAGKYRGSVVYGENSKKIVYWNLERISE